MSSGSSSQIKGGGKAILSQESQLALIDLLMSLDKEDNSSRTNDDNKELLSAHDKKREQKRFMKRLICQFEQRQLQQKFNTTTNSTTATVASKSNDSTRIEQSRGRSIANPTAQSSTNQGTNSNSSNVRIELVEAIFPKSDTKDKKKKSSSSSDTKKKKKKKKKDTSTFKIGTKKVLVLPKTTSISDILKKSKSKLKLKKTPIRAFIQHEDQGILFDLDTDISGLEDGTVLYVSVTPKPVPEEEEVTGDVGVDNEDDKDQTSMPTIIDPLESVKQAYQKQESYRNTKQYNQLLIPEVINNEKRASLSAIRQSLPVSNYKEHILQTIHENEVVVLSGQTGSGKSTQVPQFLLEESVSDSNNSTMAAAARSRRRYIVVTQPRKVAAISLASRVTDERGCPPPGVNGSSVGYMVRSDKRVCLPSCRIIYMTIGILLRMLVNQRNESYENNKAEDDNIAPLLSIDTISHLIIDETHERDVNTGKSASVCLLCVMLLPSLFIFINHGNAHVPDFVLTLLKGMISSPSSSMPRLILMSATASSDLFIDYFSTKSIVPVAIDVPGRTFPVETKWLSDCEQNSGQQSMMIRQNSDNQKNERANSNSSNGGVTLSPRATENIDNKLIRALLVKIIEEQQTNNTLTDTSDGRYRATGSILVFLPGMGEIESLARCLYEKGTIVSDRNLCKIMKLHSSVPKADQRQVFQPALVGTVKVVLATNIAETSVTIPDVSHVIDSCRVKESRYNSDTRIKELVTVWTSHASMKQRAGRAGRTSSGTCWRLCSEEFANDELLDQSIPEMARTPLDELVLQIGLLFEQRRDEYNRKAVNEDREVQRPFVPGFKPIKFLSNTPTPPAETSLIRACTHLMEVEAIRVVDGTDGEQLYRLTPLGYHLSRLPMDAKVGKMLIIGCVLGCLDNALTIAAALSGAKSCFLGHNRNIGTSSIEARDDLIEHGFGGSGWLGGTVKGDLIAVVAAYRAWKKQKHHQREKFCRSHALNSMTLQDMDTLRNQFLGLMIDAGLVSQNNGSSDMDDCNIANEDALLTSCCIVGGLYPNIATLIRPTSPKGGGRLLTNDSKDTCRPSSNSFQRTRVQQASKSGKDAYVVFHSKHRSIGTSTLGNKRPLETFLSEVNFISKFALILFGGELELLKNAIIVDKWLKFKVSSEDESGSGAKGNAVLILTLRELLDRVILEHVVETFSSPEDKTKMIDRHNRIIKVVRMILSDEG